MNTIDSMGSVSSVVRTAVRTGAATVAALCGLALTSAAWSADPPDPRLAVAVSYADLNLNGEAGAKTLYGRLRAAARTVCKSWEGRGLGESTGLRTCVDVAIEQAVEQIDQPTVTVYHLAEVGRMQAAPVRVASKSDEQE